MALNQELRKILDPERIKKIHNKKTNILRMMTTFKKHHHAKSNPHVSFQKPGSKSPKMLEKEKEFFKESKISDYGKVRF